MDLVIGQVLLTRTISVRFKRPEFLLSSGRIAGLEALLGSSKESDSCVEPVVSRFGARGAGGAPSRRGARSPTARARISCCVLSLADPAGLPTETIRIASRAAAFMPISSASSIAASPGWPRSIGDDPSSNSSALAVSQTAWRSYSYVARFRVLCLPIDFFDCAAMVFRATCQIASPAAPSHSAR